MKTITIKGRGKWIGGKITWKNLKKPTIRETLAVLCSLAKDIEKIGDGEVINSATFSFFKPTPPQPQGEKVK